MGGSLSQPAHRALEDRDELDAPYRSAEPIMRRSQPPASAAPLPADNGNLQPPLPFMSFQQSLMASFTPALPINLNVSASSSSSSPFPRLTMQQLAQLRDNGVDMDLCFVPHQMPRLTAHHLDEEGKEREKRCVTIDNCMAISQTALASSSTSSTTSSTSITAPASSIPAPDTLSLSFIVDSRVPCRVSIYPAATEVIDRNVSDQPPVFSAHPQCHLWTQTLPAGMRQSVAVPLASLFPIDVLNRAVSSPSSSSSSSSSSGSGATSSFPSLFTFSSSRHYCPVIVHCENMSYQSSSSGLLPSSAQHKRRDEQKERLAIDIDTPPTVEHLIVYLLFTKHQPASAIVAPSQPLNADTAASTGASASPAPSPTSASASSARPSPPTPAAVVRAASGPAVLGVKRLKQKIKLQHNKSYELFDLYGLREQPQSAASAAPQTAASQESPDCVICLTQKRTHAIFPCRHVCLCADCAVMLREQTNRCPICRRMVETVIPILMDESAAGGDSDSVVAGGAGGSGGGREWYERH